MVNTRKDNILQHISVGRKTNKKAMRKATLSLWKHKGMAKLKY